MGAAPPRGASGPQTTRTTLLEEGEILMTEGNLTPGTIENTASRDPLLHLLGAMSDGNDRYITDMEASGQRQLVSSTDLPTKMNSGTDDDLIALGFTLGEPHTNDPMFRPVTMPAGWSKQRTDHSMWSKVVDDLGRKRLSIFYKAAFYDRDAFINVQTIRGYAFDVINGEPPVLDDEWATAPAMRTAVQEYRDDMAEGHARYPSDYKVEQIAQADQVLSQMDGA